MRATCFLLAATTALCACLDFDVFETEPTTGSTSSTGGAGGAGGGTTSSTTTTSTGMGGMGGTGGMGGAPPELPPCGMVSDDFDAGPDLSWTLSPSGAQYANDRAVASPPQGSFSYLGDPQTVLSNCAIQIDVAVDTNGYWFFGWASVADGTKLLWFTTNPMNDAAVTYYDDGGVPLGGPAGTGIGAARVRISESEATYRVETAPLGTTEWELRFSLPAASAPAWLAQPGFPQFGTQGTGADTDAEFDNFNLP